DLVQASGFAETGDIFIAFATLPGVEGISDFGDIVLAEVAQYPIPHKTQVTGIDKQELLSSVTFLFVTNHAVGLVPGQEPDAGGDLGVGEQLAGQGDHAFHQVLFHQPLADFAFVVGVGAHGAVGQQQGHAAGGGQVVNHVLHPGEVGVAPGWGAVLPAHVIGQGLTPPVLHVEGWVGHHEVGAQVRVLVVEEGVGVLLAEVEVDAADGHVHGRQLPGGGVGFLAVYGDVLLLFGGVVVLFLGVLFNELVAGDKETAGTHGRVIHAAGVGLEYFHDQGDDALGGVVLATLLALGQ